MTITKQNDGTYRCGHVVILAKTGRFYWVVGCGWLTASEVIRYAICKGES